MTDLAYLKAKIDIIDVLDKIGARTRIPDSWEEVEVWCPFCGDAGSHKPAAKADPLKGLYYCYQCGEGGSVIDVVLLYLKQQTAKIITRTKAEGQEAADLWGEYAPSISDAVKWLEENFADDLLEEDDDDPWK